MSFFSESKRDQKVLAVLLDSGHIKAAVLDVRARREPKLIFYTEKDFDFISEPNSKELEKEFFKTLRKLLPEISSACNQNNFHPEKIVFVIGAAWYTSSNIEIRIKKNKSSFINDSEIIAELEKENSKLNPNLQVIEKQLIWIKANGYKIKALSGKKASVISAEAIFNLVDPIFISKIKKELESFFFLPNTFTTLPTLCAQTIADKISAEQFILLIPEDEITDICLIEKRTVIKSLSAPVGKNYFLRTLLENNKIKDSNSAESMIKMFLEGHLEESKKQEIEKILDQAKSFVVKIIKDGFFECLKETSRNIDSVAVIAPAEEQKIWLGILNDPYINRNGTKDFVQVFIKNDFWVYNMGNILK